jgi:hypothetical protein
VRFLIAAILIAFAATGAVAQDKKDAKKPSAAQKEQQDRMKACNQQASDKKMKGEDRQKFMSGCLKDDDQPSAAQKAQQDKMKACNKQASDKKMKGDDRQKFMSGCLKG